MCFSFGGTTAAKAGTAHFSFGGEHGSGGGDGMYFLLVGTTAVEAWAACIFFWRDHGVEDRGGIFLAGSTVEDARMACILFLVRRADFIFGSGTAEVIRHRRQDLRAGRLPLRLFGSDRNDDSQFSSRLALRR